MGIPADSVSPLLVYEKPSITLLAEALLKPSTPIDQQDLQRIPELIDRFSNDLPMRSMTETEEVEKHAVIMITGSAGSLGSHILAALYEREGIRKIYCLCRPASSEDIMSRHRSTFSYYGLNTDALENKRWSIVFLGADFSRPDLGLPPNIFVAVRF
jgi:hypothetical protein